MQDGNKCTPGTLNSERDTNFELKSFDRKTEFVLHTNSEQTLLIRTISAISTAKIKILIMK